jgi:16S rRNA C1402 (ribose-2'-O) methylase RsmI
MVSLIKNRIKKEIHAKFYEAEKRTCDTLNNIMGNIATSFAFTPREVVELIEMADADFAPYLVDRVLATTTKRKVWLSFSQNKNSARNEKILWLHIETPGHGVYKKERTIRLFSDMGNI